eukprot:TRINITY_DN13507_c0_g1_i1.p1 TRINITY_DN13507_c0_g1~~TRINITY_DN13507_c0_g1_i1.p1  ORF type:complete len:205 (-),score=58.58 TRINITY_DN13507_c0_g1_i1:41-619(-)
MADEPCDLHEESVKEASPLGRDSNAEAQLSGDPSVVDQLRRVLQRDYRDFAAACRKTVLEQKREHKQEAKALERLQLLEQLRDVLSESCQKTRQRRSSAMRLSRLQEEVRVEVRKAQLRAKEERREQAGRELLQRCESEALAKHVTQQKLLREMSLRRQELAQDPERAERHPFVAASSRRAFELSWPKTLRQ